MGSGLGFPIADLRQRGYGNSLGKSRRGGKMIVQIRRNYASMKARSVNYALLGLLVAGVGAGADWPQFRGADNRGVAIDARLPFSWKVAKDGQKSENVAWVADLPGRGVSS